jgi:hypothetical protein
MRWIRPRPEPMSFMQWRALYQNDINFGYDLLHAELRAEINDALIAESGDSAPTPASGSMRTTHTSSTCCPRRIVSGGRRMWIITTWWPAIPHRIAGMSRSAHSGKVIGPHPRSNIFSSRPVRRDVRLASRSAFGARFPRRMMTRRQERPSGDSGSTTGDSRIFARKRSLRRCMGSTCRRPESD